MDRALDPELLAEAVGVHERLPDSDGLRQLLADTEVGLFLQQGDIDEALLDTAWYLQAVATARADLDIYDVPRQRRAHQVSGHIFDLALQSTDDFTTTERLRLTLAAQVGYLGGDLIPNATALARRAPLPDQPFDLSEPEHMPSPGKMSLEVGVLVLALDRAAIYPLLDARRDQLADLESEIGDLAETPFAAVDGVVRGARELINYLTYGSRGALQEAQQHLTRAVGTAAAESDVDSRWVAAHLLCLSDELQDNSAWSALPPDLPNLSRAMTLGDPPVLSLWPPQLSFLAGTEGQPSPLDPRARRLMLSFPTSAGKTLLAQILILAHVASSDLGNVCVVAPTHSLCRELANSLNRRLRTLGRELHVEGPVWFDQTRRPPSDRVTVMTPERLAGLLRSDPAALLHKYSMFVIDEAHLVAAPTRGWRLEETLSLIHHLTVDTDHRILVLSAALGNQSHVIQWMTAHAEEPVTHHTEWRGPRRLNAVYTNLAKFDEATDEPPRGKRLARQYVPIYGEIRLRTGNITTGRRITEPVGTLVLRRTKGGEWKRDGDSTTERERLVPLITHVAGSGAVLVIQPTRVEAQRLAQDVADAFDDEASTALNLTDLARARLTEAHPLTQIVPKGVAFHHAALPVDIQAEIEDAVRAGHVRVLVATSTLIEGVNLPFKTVIVGRRGYIDPDGEQVESIDAAGLLNAVGRAGRAGRETEGWMILAEQSSAYSDHMFEPLQRTGNDLEIRSTITTEQALAGLSGFETLSRTAEDAIFQNYDAATDGFLSFIWFVAQALEDLDRAASSNEIVAVIRHTLAWQQLGPTQQRQLVRAANAALVAFEAQPRDQRSRWSRSGASLPTARTLDTVAERLLARLGSNLSIDLEDLPAIVDFVLNDETLTTLLGLQENTRRGFKPYRNAPRDKFIDVNIKTLLLDWVEGVEIQDLADQHLTDIREVGYRSEALAEFSASVFEHHLPWTLGVVLQWVNAQMAATGSANLLPEHLPAAIHYGVSTKTAIDLMRGGIRSRRLANAVATHADGRTSDSESPLRDWLGSQTITAWRELFDASPTEVADLLSFARTPGAQVVSSVLAGSDHEVAIDTSGRPIGASETAALEQQPDVPEPAPIQVLTPAGVIGTIRPTEHEEVSQLLNIGVQLSIAVTSSETGPTITISLAP